MNFMLMPFSIHANQVNHICDKNLDLNIKNKLKYSDLDCHRR